MATKKQQEQTDEIVEAIAPGDQPQRKALNVNNDALRIAMDNAKQAESQTVFLYESQISTKQLNEIKDQGYEVEKVRFGYEINLA